VTSATFNGQPSLTVSERTFLRGRADESRRHLSVWLEDEPGSPLWGPRELELGPDPRHLHSDSRSADYLALCWPQARAVIVLGWSGAVVLDAGTGAVRRVFSAVFTGKSSLDVADLRLIADERLLLVSSTRRVWVVGSDLEPLERLDPIGPLAGVPEVRGHGITIREYDLEDPAGGYLEEEWTWPDSGIKDAH
jgi:hypothetical protein